VGGSSSAAGGSSPAVGGSSAAVGGSSSVAGGSSAAAGGSSSVAGGSSSAPTGFRRREQVFSGWGEPGAGPSLPPHAEPLLREELGVPGGVVSRPISLDDVTLARGRLPAHVRERLSAVAEVRDDRVARILRCRGKSYLDLLAQRAGDCADAPDAVVIPGDVEAVLRICAEHGVAVVPFGGGTSVVGGLAGLRGPFEALVSLDLGRLDRVLGVDATSLTAVFEPGIRLPEADRALRERGLTLGHVPQSYEWASVGGCVATRSAGQVSTGYGRIDANVLGLDLTTPSGRLHTLDIAATAAGPDLRELAIGSEGALGVITRVALRVHPLPDAVRREGWALPTFADGVEALRRLGRDGLAPDIARLSDEQETRLSLALAGTGRVGQALLGGRCLLVLGWEGRTGRRRAVAKRLLRWGALPLGAEPGRAWAASRLAGPYLRDDLMDRGVLVETVETATSWSNLAHLHDTVRSAFAGAHVGCHVSHLYPTGASLYFTILARQDADPAAQWRALKARALDVIVAAGGTVTHHHAIGHDHAPWLPAEIGPLGINLLRTLKAHCDPAGIMNPGKLLPQT
jgi:alkyldihydroxyacetonephosphate synthase